MSLVRFENLLRRSRTVNSAIPSSLGAYMNVSRVDGFFSIRCLAVAWMVVTLGILSLTRLRSAQRVFHFISCRREWRTSRGTNGDWWPTRVRKLCRHRKNFYHLVGNNLLMLKKMAT